MKLPLVDTYAFPVTVPSSNTAITIRPFLVKEEKLLLMAQQSKSYDEQVEAISQVIRNCTNNQVEPKTAPFFDIEYLLIQLRTRSVGETINPYYVCRNTVDGEECGHRTAVAVNLQEIKVTDFVTTTPVKSLQVSSRYVLNLRYPTVYTVQRLLLFNASIDAAERSKLAVDVVDSLIDVFDTLEDKDTGTLYKFDDFGRKEKIEFLNSLLSTDYEKITQFVAEMPTVYVETSYTCEKCAFEHNIRLQGMSDFLD